MTTCGSMSTFKKQAKQTTTYVSRTSLFKMLCHDQKWQHNGSLRLWSKPVFQQLNTPRPSRSSAKLRMNTGSTSSSLVESTTGPGAAAAGLSGALAALDVASTALLFCHQMQVLSVREQLQNPCQANISTVKQYPCKLTTTCFSQQVICLRHNAEQ